MPDAVDFNRIKPVETRVTGSRSAGLVHGRNSQAALGQCQNLHDAMWETEE